MGLALDADLNLGVDRSNESEGRFTSLICLILHCRQRWIPPPPPVITPLTPHCSLFCRSCTFRCFPLCPILPPHIEIVLVPRFRVILSVTIGNIPVDTSPHILPPLSPFHSAATVIATVVITDLPFLLLLLLFIIIIRLLTEKCLVSNSK